MTVIKYRFRAPPPRDNQIIMMEHSTGEHSINGSITGNHPTGFPNFGNFIYIDVVGAPCDFYSSIGILVKFRYSRLWKYLTSCSVPLYHGE